MSASASTVACFVLPSSAGRRSCRVVNYLSGMGSSGGWRLQQALAVGVVFLAVLASCGGSDSEATVFEDAGFLAVPGEGSGIADEIAIMKSANEAAAGCMREQGYPYQPWSGFELMADSALTAPPLGTAEYAEQRGYGLLFNFPEQILTHPSAKQDPNQVFFDGLSDEEKFAYSQTRLGVDGGDGVRRASVDEELYDEGGCLGRELRAAGNYERGNLLGSLFGPYEQLEDQVNADARLLDYDEGWSACMAEAGFQFESSPRARASFQAHFDELWASVVFPATAVPIDEVQSMSEADRTELYSLQPEFDRDQWQRWRDEEITVATADAECQGDSLRYDIFVEVLAEFEDQFVADNQVVFDQLDSATS